MQHYVDLQTYDKIILFECFDILHKNK